MCLQKVGCTSSLKLLPRNLKGCNVDLRAVSMLFDAKNDSVIIMQNSGEKVIELVTVFKKKKYMKI